MTKLIPAALYWLKILVSLGHFCFFFQPTKTSKREGNLCHVLISRILCLLEPMAPPDPPRQRVPRAFLTSSNSSAIPAASPFHFSFALISQRVSESLCTQKPHWRLAGKSMVGGGNAGRNPFTTSRHGGCLLRTEVQHTISLYGPGFKELDRKKWRAIAEELSEAAGTSMGDPGQQGNCWLCQRHLRHDG